MRLRRIRRGRRRSSRSKTVVIDGGGAIGNVGHGVDAVIDGVERHSDGIWRQIHGMIAMKALCKAIAILRMRAGDWFRDD